MPIIEVKAFEGRFDDRETRRLLIERLTAAMRDTYDKATAADTWVILTPVAPENWGIAGGPAGWAGVVAVVSLPELHSGGSSP